MTLKRFTLVLALLALLTAGVSAQDDSGLRRFSRVSIRHGAFAFSLDDPILLEATALDAEALRAALMDGSTIADLIQTNEGDVAAVIADMQAQATADINARAASFLEGLEERVSEELDAGHSRRGFWGRRWHRLPRIFAYAGVGDTVMEATGLDAAGLRSALAEGATIAELIEANDGDMASVVTDIVATITDAVNHATAQRVDSLEGDISEAFNSNFAEKWRRWRKFPKPRGFSGFWGPDSAPDKQTAATADG
ncbi:MAG: hypothetical protein OXG39_07005 [Chloroflexi bacterium]|nr:hypothetical protein [Chloroflexota bacterium]